MITITKQDIDTEKKAIKESSCVGMEQGPEFPVFAALLIDEVKPKVLSAFALGMIETMLAPEPSSPEAMKTFLNRLENNSSWQSLFLDIAYLAYRLGKLDAQREVSRGD